MSVANTKEVRRERFRGLNLRDDDIGDDEARDVLNMVGKPRGGVVTRDGTSRFAQSAMASLMQSGGRFIDIWPVGYQRSDSLHSIGGGIVNKDSKPALFAMTADRAPSSLGLGDVVKFFSIFGDGTVRSHGQLTTSGDLVEHGGSGRVGVATGPNGIYLASAGRNGSGPPLAWVIGTASDTPANWTLTAGALPEGNVLRWWSTRMLMTGIAFNPARIAASTIGDPNYWSTTADANGNKAWTVDLEPGDGDVIVGWGAFDTYLIVFKRRRSWVIYDGDTGANRILSPQHGATSPQAIVETPYGVCFQKADYSVWIATGTKVQRLSEMVDPWLNASAVLGYANDHLYVSVPSGIERGSPTSGTFEYDFITEDWRCHSFVATEFASQDFDDGRGQLLFGVSDASSAGHNLLRYFDPATNDDVGSSYDSYWATGHQKFGSEVAKRITELRVEGQGIVDVSFSKERAPETFQRTVDMTNGGAANWGQARVLTPGVARSWGFKFAHSGTGYISLDAYAASLRPCSS